MQKLKNIVIVDGDETGSFISKGVFNGLNVPYKITYISGIWEGLDYLKQAYPKGTQAAEGKDLLLLGITLESIGFLEELENSQQIDSRRLYIILLTHMFTERENEKVKAFKNIDACFPQILSEPVVSQILDSYLDTIPNHLNKGENNTSASALNRPSIPFRNNQRKIGQQ